MQLFPVLEADRVINDVRVNVVGVGMGSNDAFVIGKQLFGKLTGNPIGLPWRDLLLIREGLDEMKEAYVVCFLEQLLRRHHFEVAGVGHTVDAAFDSNAITAYFFILKHIGQRAEHPSAGLPLGTFRLNLKGRKNMNIFENESGILGSASVDNLKESIKEFFKQANEIRTRLGKQGYLLDKYLSYLFEATNGMLVYEAATEGFETESTLNSLCAEILKGDTKSKAHPFYQQVKTFIDAHPLKYQECFTQQSLYSVMLLGSYLESVYEQYYADLLDDIRAFLDIVDLNNLYNKICEALGGEKEMEHLNLLFCERFLIAKAMDIFLQGMTNQLLYSLTYRDRETSKQVFQLLLDEAFYH